MKTVEYQCQKILAKHAHRKDTFFQYSGEFLYQAHHLTNDYVNHIFSWFGFGTLLVQIALVPLVVRRILPEKIVPWAMLIIGVSLIGMGLVSFNVNFYLLLVLYCIGIGFFLPNIYAYVSNNTPTKQQGRVMATLTASQGLMDIIVTLLGSFFVAFYLPTPFVVGGVIILMSLLVWSFSKQKIN